jgi:hypothetical protein
MIAWVKKHESKISYGVGDHQWKWTDGQPDCINGSMWKVNDPKQVATRNLALLCPKKEIPPGWAGSLGFFSIL